MSISSVMTADSFGAEPMSKNTIGEFLCGSWYFSLDGLFQNTFNIIELLNTAPSNIKQSSKTQSALWVVDSNYVDQFLPNSKAQLQLLVPVDQCIFFERICLRHLSLRRRSRHMFTGGNNGQSRNNSCSSQIFASCVQCTILIYVRYSMMRHNAHRWPVRSHSDVLRPTL